MHKLSASFVLAYHGCDRSVGEKLLNGEPFRLSRNEYDWLGEGIYFWEANPMRGLEFAREVAVRDPGRLKDPFVVGAILDLGFCLDLTTSAGLQMVRESFEQLTHLYKTAGEPMPKNRPDKFLHPLDCAVINNLHRIRAAAKQPAVDSVKGIFQESPELYPGSSFMQKNHIQIAIRNRDCIKGVFRVPEHHLDSNQQPS
uniref:Uncharacterized protein n=1 Tax=Acidobacterium capsulatum TaxID=33075 RepID=A0A7V5CTU5_9BACT